MTAPGPRREIGAEARESEARPRLIALAFAAALLLACLYVAAIGTEEGRRIDGTLLGAPDHRGRVFSLAEWTVDAFGLQIAAPVAAALILFSLVSRGTRTALVLITAIGGAVASARLFKEMLASTDPLGGETVRGIGSGFFPSGHSTTIMALVLAAVALARSTRSRRALAAIGALIAAAIGVAHVVVASHQPSDVVAGFLLALVWIASAAAVICPSGAKSHGCRACASPLLRWLCWRLSLERAPWLVPTGAVQRHSGVPP